MALFKLFKFTESDNRFLNFECASYRYWKQLCLLLTNNVSKFK